MDHRRAWAHEALAQALSAVAHGRKLSESPPYLAPHLPPNQHAPPALISRLQEEPPALFRARVEAALEYIRAGEIYQANLSRVWRAQLQPQLPDESGVGASVTVLYERLRTSNPAPFAALACCGDWRLLCSSPERLVAVAEGRVQTRPIAGTRPRSREPGADASELAALIAHPKERAEHVMLIDLERNDLGRICEAGSVRAG